MSDDIGYQRGDVVACYEHYPLVTPSYGVVVATPTQAIPHWYRVRVSTKSDGDYVEISVDRENIRLVRRYD